MEVYDIWRDASWRCMFFTEGVEGLASHGFTLRRPFFFWGGSAFVVVWSNESNVAVGDSQFRRF